MNDKFKTDPIVSLGRLSRRRYLKVLKSSQAIISPFAWGEICYRDFEAFVSGASLIKPELDHLETWPNLFKKHITYTPISWRIEDWNENLNNILTDKKNLLEIARNGQELYKKLWDSKGREKFSVYFSNLIDF